MFKDVRNFDYPSDTEKIWRYMDLAKFMSILEKRALFFPTIELLQKTDPWEGSWSNFTWDRVKVGNLPDDPEWERELHDITLIPRYKIGSKQVCVQCWYQNDYESYAMWKSYTSGSGGLCIQTTVGKLKQSFNFDDNWPVFSENLGKGEIPLHIGKVKYVDWGNPDYNHMLGSYLCKGRAFTDEHEIRLLAPLHPLPGSYNTTGYKDINAIIEDDDLGLDTEVLNQIKSESGIYLSIYPETLIENVYVAPTSGKWFYKLIEQILKRYNLPSNIRWSGNKKPKY